MQVYVHVIIRKKEKQNYLDDLPSFLVSPRLVEGIDTGGASVGQWLGVFGVAQTRGSPVLTALPLSPPAGIASPPPPPPPARRLPPAHRPRFKGQYLNLGEVFTLHFCCVKREGIRLSQGACRLKLLLRKYIQTWLSPSKEPKSR